MSSIDNAQDNIKDKVILMETILKNLEEQQNATKITMGSIDTDIKKVYDRMSVIIEQANNILINDGQQDAKLKKLENQHNSLDMKMKTLNLSFKNHIGNLMTVMFILKIAM